MYAIKWTNYGYVGDRTLGSALPYTNEIEEAKKWATLDDVHGWLDRKDKTWASQCKVIEVGDGDDK